MNTHNPNLRAPGAILTRDQAADLLARYPNVSESEARAIVSFLRKGRHLDVGILTGDETLKSQLDNFMADHKSDFKVGIGEAAALVAGIAGFLVACSLLWEAVKPGPL